MRKNSNTKSISKKKRRYERREEGKTLEEKSQVNIIRLFILLVSQYFLYLSFKKEK